MACVSTLRPTCSYLYPQRPKIGDTALLKEGTKAGELCTALLDMNCCHTNGGSISKADTLITQLSNHPIINITDDLVSEGAFTGCALYQVIGSKIYS